MREWVCHTLSLHNLSLHGLLITITVGVSLFFHCSPLRIIWSNFHLAQHIHHFIESYFVARETCVDIFLFAKNIYLWEPMTTGVIGYCWVKSIARYLPELTDDCSMFMSRMLSVLIPNIRFLAWPNEVSFELEQNKTAEFNRNYYQRFHKTRSNYKLAPSFGRVKKIKFRIKTRDACLFLGIFLSVHGL